MLPAPATVADSVVAAPSSVDGGRVEVVTQTAATLRHTWTSPGGSWAPAVDVRSEVWAEPDLPTVHRRS